MDAFAKSHLIRAVALFKTQAEFGRAIGRSQQYVSFLLNNAKKIPAEIAIAIDSVTGGAVSKSQLCPKLWPPIRSDTGCGRGPKASEQAA